MFLNQRGQRIRGLTTAVGLWASACMGLVIGSGFYEAAIIMCAFLFCVIAGLNRWEGKYLKNSVVMRLYIEYAVDASFSTIHAVLRGNHWHLFYLEHLGGINGAVNRVIVDVQCSRQDADEQTLLEALRAAASIRFVEEA